MLHPCTNSIRPCLLTSRSTGPATINTLNRSGNKAGLIGKQKGNQLGDLHWISLSIHTLLTRWHINFPCLLYGHNHRRSDGTWSDGVDSNVWILPRSRLSQASNSMLTCGIASPEGDSNQRRDASSVDLQSFRPVSFCTPRLVR